MSQILSNSIPGNKSMSILIFTLVFFNVARSTFAIPADFPVAFEDVKELVQPVTSSYWGWGIGDIISYGVEKFQSAMKTIIGIEDHPREFYVVHIKDEKNPDNNKEVLREVGHEGKGDDIPVKGGKLPGNSLIVNKGNPVTEYVSSPETTAPQTNSIPIAVSDKQTPIIESKSQNGNNASTTPAANGDNSPAVAPLSNDANVNPPSAPSDTQNPHSEIDLSPTSQKPDSQPSNVTGSPHNEYSLKPAQQPAIMPAAAQVEKVDQSASQEGKGDPRKQTGGESQNSGNLLPMKVETLSPVFPRKEIQSHEYNALSNSTQNHNSNDVIDDIVTQPKILIPPTPQFVNSNHNSLGSAESDISKILEPLANQTIQKVTPIIDDEFPQHPRGEKLINDHNLGPSSSKIEEPEPPQDIQEPFSSDPKESMSVYDCEMKFESELCGKNPQLCAEFQSDEEFFDYVKLNSGCTTGGHQKTPLSLNDADESPEPYTHEPKPTQQNIQEPPSSDPTDSISVHECETKFESELCGKKPQLCAEFQSDEEFFDYVKLNSGCTTGAQQKNPPPSNKPDESAEPHTHEPEPTEHNIQEPPSSDPKDSISVHECETKFESELCVKNPEVCARFESYEEFIDYVKQKSGCTTKAQQKPPPPANNSDEPPEPHPYDPNELISMNECETKFEKELCDNDPGFCGEFQSDEEFIDYVKKNSDCAPGGQEKYPSPANNLAESEEPHPYDPNELISMNECETKYEKELCDDNPGFCGQFQSDHEFIDYVKKYSGCEAGVQENSGHDVDENPSQQEHHSHDSEPPENFDEHHVPDHDNDALSNPPLKSNETPEKKKGGTKKKSKSNKEKRSKNKS